jgi:GT2 family glycosyltransferase
LGVDSGTGPADAYEGEIIVVDNASTDGTVEAVAGEFPSVVLIANVENRGFTGGNNQGMQASSGQFVLFLNPDTEVAPDALAALLDYMSAHPEVGACGPELRYGDGSWQSSRRRFPSLASALTESTPLGWHLPPRLNPWARRYRFEDSAPGADAQRVDWLVGAALMCRRSVLDQVGGFDEGYFMYSEELDWCRRAAAAGWEIHYVPWARVIHYEGKSSEQAVAARHIHFQSSKVRYFRKFHGRLAAGILLSAILAMYGLELGIEAVKWAAGSKRALRGGRVAAYRQLLRSGLSG